MKILENNINNSQLINVETNFRTDLGWEDGIREFEQDTLKSIINPAVNFETVRYIHSGYTGTNGIYQSDIWFYFNFYTRSTSGTHAGGLDYQYIGLSPESNAGILRQEETSFFRLEFYKVPEGLLPNGNNRKLVFTKHLAVPLGEKVFYNPINDYVFVPVFMGSNYRNKENMFLFWFQDGTVLDGTSLSGSTTGDTFYMTARFYNTIDGTIMTFLNKTKDPTEVVNEEVDLYHRVVLFDNYSYVVYSGNTNHRIGTNTLGSPIHFYAGSISPITTPIPTPSVTASSVTPTPTPTISVSVTPTISLSSTPSISISFTPSITVSTSISATVTPSVTPSISISPTPSRSVPDRPCVTNSPSSSLVTTPSATPTISVSTTPSVSISRTPSISISATPGASMTPSISISRTPSISVTPSISISRTPSVSITPSISVTPPSVSSTPSISISSTPSISVTPSISISRTPSISVTPSISISVTPSVSITPSTSGAPLTPYDDWFFPSSLELSRMDVELHNFGVGFFNTDRYYASSTEYPFGGLAYMYMSERDFSDGSVTSGNKSGPSMYIRPARKFNSSTVYALRDQGPAGGWIFRVTSLGGGLYEYYECTPTNYVRSTWSNITNVEVGTSANSAIGMGPTNTAMIIAQPGHTDSAAKFCDDLIIYN